MVSALQSFTLDLIRSDSAAMSWMEERRHDWTPVAQSVLEKIVEGFSVVLVTDSKREWLSRYIMSYINDPLKNRPIVPIFELSSLLPNYKDFVDSGDFEMVNDMLSISLNGNYLFWYIGRANIKIASILKNQPDNFLWLFDEDRQNSFFLRSADTLLDIKLLHLVRIFEKTLDAVMVGEIEL